MITLIVGHFGTEPSNVFTGIEKGVIYDVIMVVVRCKGSVLQFHSSAPELSESQRSHFRGFMVITFRQ